MGAAEVLGRTAVSLGLVALPIVSMLALPQAFGWTIAMVLLVPLVWVRDC